MASSFGGLFASGSKQSNASSADESKHETTEGDNSHNDDHSYNLEAGASVDAGSRQQTISGTTVNVTDAGAIAALADVAKSALGRVGSAVGGDHHYDSTPDAPANGAIAALRGVPAAAWLGIATLAAIAGVLVLTRGGRK